MRISAQFQSPYLPYFLLLPHLLIVAIFFLWPFFSTITDSIITLKDQTIQFVGMKYYWQLLQENVYWNAWVITLVFACLISLTSLLLGLLLAEGMNRLHWGRWIYTSLFLWPFAVSPAAAGLLFKHIFYSIYVTLNGWQSFLLISLVGIWQQTSFDFVFCVIALRTVPKVLLESAAVDGAGVWRRFWTISIPLIAPVIVFLLLANVLYVLFDTFSLIQLATQGGPGYVTQTLIYKLVEDGVGQQKVGLAGAQSVILTGVIVLLFWITRRIWLKKIKYSMD